MTENRPGHPAPARDVIAFAGLVAAVPLWPLGLVLSLWAMVRTRSGRRPGWHLAVAGTTISAYLGLVTALVLT